MKTLRWILWPLALLYGSVQEVRNWLFKLGLLKPASFDIPIVSIGNLAVGGSGKTPMVKFLISALSPTYTVAVLSRGYGRKSSGFRIVYNNSTASEVGDEPLEIKTTYPEHVVCVAEDRVLGVTELLQQHPDVNLILLDDAFQHQYIRPKVSLLLSRYNQPFYKDYVMPMGRLREFRKNVNRADAVIFTRSSGLPLDHDLLQDMPVFYCNEKSGDLYRVYGSSPLAQKALVVSALADNEVFVNHVSSVMHVYNSIAYRDHYPYTAADIKSWPIQDETGQPISWVTTEKDWVKLKPLVHQLQPKANIFTIAVTPVFRDSTFMDWLINQIDG